MFTSSLAEEVKALEDDIEIVKDKVDDPMICEKIKLFINAPPEIQAFYKEESGPSSYSFGSTSVTDRDFLNSCRGDEHARNCPSFF